MLRATAMATAMAIAVGVTAALPGARLPSASAQESGPRGPTERERAIHTLGRLSFGARPGEVEQVEKEGWKVWVERQLAPEAIDDAALERRLKGLGSLGMTNRELIDTYWPPPKDESPAEQRRVQQLGEVPGRELQSAVLLRAVYSERQLLEVMCEFWRNHFSVDLEKDEVRYLAPSYERDVIRKHAFGRFEDLLLASARHPCMLIYLDNVLSQRPLTDDERKALERAGPNPNARLRQLQRERGLNENYAREVMELHTLGVDNGYSQRDVTELARVLTGWTVDRGRGNSWEFRFHEAHHDPHPKRVLSWSLRPDGEREGELVLRGLAQHKGTARFLAHKLLVYLVSDEPPKDYVDRVARVFERSKGDLVAVYRAIIFDDAFFAPAFYRGKFKTPFEFTASMMRAVDADVVDPQPVLQALARMRQPIYRCQDPTGYYDTAEAWLDPGVMALRWQYALDLAEQPMGAVRIPERFFGRAPPSVSLRHWLEAQIVPAGLSASTTAVIERHLAAEGTQRAGAQRRVTGLLLGSPEFQRQ